MERPYLAISIGANLNGHPITSNFVLMEDNQEIKVFNETI